MAVVEQCAQAYYSLLFEESPGIPAEDRWTAFHPFASWMCLFSGLFSIGCECWLWAFRDSEELARDVKEEGSPEHIQRIQNGKRMKASKDMMRHRLLLMARGFTMLMAARHLDRWISLMIRDIGPMKFFDFHARRKLNEPDDEDNV